MDSDPLLLTAAGAVSVPHRNRRNAKAWAAAVAALAVAAGVVVAGPSILAPGAVPAAAPLPPAVSVSLPFATEYRHQT